MNSNDALAALDKIQYQAEWEWDAKDCNIIREYITAQQWQPISTAPRDEKWVLLCEEGEVFTGYWSRMFKEWRDMGDIGCNGYYEVSPTHWMPLPDTPEIEAAQKEKEND